MRMTLESADALVIEPANDLMFDGYHLALLTPAN